MEWSSEDILEIGEKVTAKKWHCKGIDKILLGKIATITGYNEDSPDGVYYYLDWEDKETTLDDGRKMHEVFNCEQADAFRRATTKVPKAKKKYKSLEGASINELFSAAQSHLDELKANGQEEDLGWVIAEAREIQGILSLLREKIK